VGSGRRAPAAARDGDVVIEVDLAVVGAGPAGSAAALGALTADPTARVVLLDRATFPRDKVCGDGLGPEGVDVLRRLHVVEEVLAGAAPLHDVRLVAPDGTVAAGRAPRPGYVVPRLVLDDRLRTAALAAGAEARTHRVRDVRQRGGWVEVDGVVRARTVVGADGANGVVRRCVRAGAQPRRHTGVAMRGYGRASAVDELVIAFVDDRWPAYAWAFPTGDGTVNVGYGPFDATMLDDRRGLVDSLRRHGAALGVEPDPATLRAHHLPLSTHRPWPAHGRVLLTGDAASLVNPFTGEGIYYALLSGALAGRAAVRAPDDPGSAYAGALRARIGRHLRHTSAAARVFRSTFPVDQSVRAAARSSAVLADLCEFALGTGLLTPRLVAGLTRAWLTDVAGRPR
jgi:geranylgeranyl reductase family protein